MSFKTYIKKAFEKKLLIFAVVWSIISFFIATAVVQILEGINMIMDFLLKIIIYGLSSPSLAAGYIPYFGDKTISKFIITFVIALLATPIAYKIWEVVRSIMKKSPV